MNHPIILYDGVCGLCNRLVQFVLRRDRVDVFRFASLQSALGAQILARHGRDPGDLDTLYVVSNHGSADESLASRSAAVIFILKRLGGIWVGAAFSLRLVPKVVRDWGYDRVARNRYRVFGRYDTCPVPSAEQRAKFLDES